MLLAFSLEDIFDMRFSAAVICIGQFAFGIEDFRMPNDDARAGLTRDGETHIAACVLTEIMDRSALTV